MGTRKSELPSPADFPHQLVRASQAGSVPGKAALGLGVAARGIYAWVAQSITYRGEPLRDKDALIRADNEELARLRQDRDGSDDDSAWSPTIPSVMDM